MVANKTNDAGTVQVMLRLPASVYRRLETHPARRTLPIGTFARTLVVMALDRLDDAERRANPAMRLMPGHDGDVLALAEALDDAPASD